VSKRAKLGDVVEIPTKKGLAYAQNVHIEPNWGSLLVVLPGFHASRPPSFVELVAGPEQFVTFFPLTQAINRRVFDIVANVPIPEERRKLPVFREAGFIDRQGNVRDSWILDDQKRRVTRLTDELRRLPILEVINDTLLVERIEESWTPASDRLSQ
jgi:hypothetical protein